MISPHIPFHQKYRPKNLDELVGQEIVSLTLKQALLTAKIAPAYLFSGPRGTGKTSSARIFAKSLNCLSFDQPNPLPCGQCSLCQDISKGNALDIIEIDAASNTGVENIREIIERSRFAPTQARWKVYVIDECHMLSTAASNALLKTIEEPPDKVVFILATTNPERVLSTIQSRCQKYDFNRISINDICKHLISIAEKESIAFDNAAIEIIARRSNGGMRDAQSLLDQLSLIPGGITRKNVEMMLGEVSEFDLINLVKALITKNVESLITSCSKLYDSGNEPITILEGLLNITRDILLQLNTKEYSSLYYTSKEFYPEINNFSKQVDNQTILYWHSSLKNIEYQIKTSSQARLWLEVNLSSLLAMPQRGSDALLKNDIKKENDNLLKNSDSNNDEDFIQLKEQWSMILSKLELPSTRMLLSQQANLLSVKNNIVEISLSPNWENMIKSRKVIIENAVKKIFGDNMNVKFSSEEKPQANHRYPKNSNLKEKKIDKIKPTDKSDLTKINNEIPSSNDINSSKNLAQFFNGEIIETNE